MEETPHPAHPHPPRLDPPDLDHRAL